MRTSLTLYSFRFTVLSSLGLLHGCGGSVAPGPTRNTTEGATTGTTGSSTGTVTGSSTGTTTGSGTGSGTGTTGTTTGSGTGTTTGSGTGTTTGTTTGVVTVTGTGTGTATGSGGGTTVNPPTAGSAPMVATACDGPETDLGNGLFECANRLVHRVEAITCTTDYPRAEPVQDRFSGTPTFAAGGAGGGPDDGGAPTLSFDLAVCTYDADCNTEYPYARCEAYLDVNNLVTSYCQTGGCVNDTDCEDGQACECDGLANQCTSAQCRTDADCSAGNVCLRFEYDTGCGPSVSYACTTPNDACRLNSECNAQGINAGCQPAWDPALPGAQCGTLICQEGRPFLVDGAARVATLEARADWTLPQDPKLFDLTDAERRHLAGEWQRTALAEHASIAAFARFTLDLLAVGAPPELLEQTQQAMRDETLHTKLAFGLANGYATGASGYAGQNIGPGPLSCDGALGAHDLESIARNTVLEGCIGETLAALDAQHALEHCADPVVRSVLEQIARDEANHAELAWKFVQWALSQDPSLAAGFESLVQSELANARRSASRSASLGTEWTRAHGVLPESDRVALRLSALEEVVLPCMRALSATVPSDATHHAERARSVAAGALVA